MYIELDTGILEVDSNELLIPLSFALFDMTDFSKRKGDTTKTIKMPATDSNRKLLGFQELPYSTTYLNNQFITARVRDEGTIYLDGHLQFLSANKKEYECVIVGSNADWSTRLRQYKLSDLDLSEADHVYDYNTIVSSWDNTKKYVYPFIDYGLLKNKTSDFTVYDFKPAIRYSFLVQQMFKQLGYRVSGSFLSEIENVFMPFCLDKLTADVTGLEWGATATTQTIITPTQLGKNITIDTISGNGVLLDSLGRILIPIRAKYKIKVAIDLTLNELAPSGDLISLSLSMAKIGDDGHKAFSSIRNGIYTNQVAYFEINESDFLQLSTRVSGYDEVFFSLAYNGVITPYPDITLNSMTVEAIPLDEALEDMPLIMSEQMPDINCLEFLTDIKDFYNLYFFTDVNNGTVTIDTRAKFFKSLNDAIDWTDKEDLSRDTVVRYLSQNTPKVLRYAFAKDNNDGIIKAIEKNNNIDFGSGAFEFDNVFSTDEKKQSLKHIAPSFTVDIDDASAQQRFGFISQHIKIHGGDGGVVPDFSTATKPRIAIYLGKEAVQGLFTFEGIEQTHYPKMVSYNEENNLLFGDVDTLGHVKKYYNGENTQRNNAKVVTKYFYLNKSDISNLDLRYPVKVDNEFYFVNKVSDWTPRSVTKVELVTITDYEVDTNLTARERKVSASDRIATTGTQLAKFELSMGYDSSGNFVIVDKGEPLITLDKTFNTFTFGQAQLKNLKTNIVVTGTSIPVSLTTYIDGVKRNMNVTSV